MNTHKRTTPCLICRHPVETERERAVCLSENRSECVERAIANAQRREEEARK